MRILHVLTTVDGDARRPGDVSLCVEQCRALGRLGHDGDVLLGWRGRRAAPARLGGLDGLDVTGVRVGGPDGTGTVSPGARTLLRRLRADARRYDVAHLHGLEDPLVAAAARVLRRAGVPYVVEPGDRPLPVARRRVRGRTDPAGAMLRGAGHWLVASAEQAAALQAVGGCGTAVTAVRRGLLPYPVPAARPPRDTPPDRADVVLLGRLGPDRPVLALARCAARLVADGAGADFCVVGPDAGARAELLLFIGGRADLADRLRYEGRLGYDAARERLLAADAVVVTAAAEPCPVGLPEALAAGLPVLQVSSAPLPPELDGPGVRHCPPEPDAVLDALRQLLQDAARPDRAARATAALEAAHPAEAAAGELLEVYARCADRPDAGRPRVPDPRRTDPLNVAD